MIAYVLLFYFLQCGTLSLTQASEKHARQGFAVMFFADPAVLKCNLNLDLTHWKLGLRKYQSDF